MKILSQVLIDQQPNLPKKASITLSEAFINNTFPPSCVDFDILEIVVKQFGSDCLKNVMKSYCNYKAKHLTAKEIINLQFVDVEHFAIPPGFSLLEAKVAQDYSKCTLEQIHAIKRKCCIEVQLPEIILHMVAVAKSNPFIITWLIPSNLISDILRSIKTMKTHFFEECRITSLTLDKMWLYISEVELEAMWLSLSDARVYDLFHTMRKQTLQELKCGEISVKILSRVLSDQQPHFSINTSTSLSEAFIEDNFTFSFIDVELISMIVKHFGSVYLKMVMKSYCNFMSVFTKRCTAQQYINLQRIHLQSCDELPPNFVLLEAKISQDASECTLECIDTIRQRYCTEIQLSDINLPLVTIAKSNPFIVRWLVPSDIISSIVKISVKADLFEEYKLSSLTLDCIWLYLSEAEIEAMWSHVRNTNISDLFHAMHEQFIHVVKIEKISVKELSQYLVDQHPNLTEKTCYSLVETFIEHCFCPYFEDFDMLNIIVEHFGNNCLKSVMMSYCNRLSVFLKCSTAQEFTNSKIIHDKHPFDLKTECRIMKEASEYTLDDIKNLKLSICSEIGFSTFAFATNNIRNPVSGSFSISWVIPTSLASELMELVSQLDSAFYVKNNITSLSIGNEWVYNPKLFQLSTELKKHYWQSMYSPSPVEWIPSPTKKIFRLAMIEREKVQQVHIEDRFVQMTFSGRVDDILHAKSPVELENIFRSTKDVILIEGAPGSGKSTLAVHMCQRWGIRELFQQFIIVIFVQLRDPRVQIAQTITDLLPVENTIVANELTDDLVSTNGYGVLWVLDGWDELPPNLHHHSIFHKLIKRMLGECSVVVTSRPISSGDLHPEVSSQIEVLGFTPEEQRQYFHECLQGNTKALEVLLKKIHNNPMIQSICYLPLNAAFVVHIFNYNNQSLPNTEYEIYLSIILSCIQRHFEREGKGQDLPRKLASLDDLSKNEAVKEPFQHLCKLAYRGVIKNKVTFSSSDLPLGLSTLSLLQVTENILQNRKSLFYNFIHLSIQEVLSAYYIATWLSERDQLSQFQQLFNQPRFVAVFQFYAAITKLKSPGIRQVISRIVEQKSKPLLLSLLHCLYGIQEPSLCLNICERLKYKLDFSQTLLSPQDCLSISCFLFLVSCKEISVDLWKCYTGDVGAKFLTDHLVDQVGKVTFEFSDNEIHEEGASHVARMLCCIQHLYLSRNLIKDKGASLISNAVGGTTMLKTLILSKCGISSKGAEDLSNTLAKNSFLEKLDISQNNLGDVGINLIAEALQKNKQLKELWIGKCGITDKGAASLGRALSVNSSLKMLHMGEDGELLTEGGLLTMTYLFADNSTFKKLAIFYEFDFTGDYLRWKVNEARKRKRLPPIEIEGEYCVAHQTIIIPCRI